MTVQTALTNLRKAIKEKGAEKFMELSAEQRDLLKEEMKELNVALRDELGGTHFIMQVQTDNAQSISFSPRTTLAEIVITLEVLLNRANGHVPRGVVSAMEAYNATKDTDPDDRGEFSKNQVAELMQRAANNMPPEMRAEFMRHIADEMQSKRSNAAKGDDEDDLLDELLG